MEIQDGSDDWHRPGDEGNEFADELGRGYPNAGGVPASGGAESRPDIDDDQLDGTLEPDAEEDERPVVTEADIEGFRQAAQYLEDVGGRAFGSFFIAIAKQEPVHSEPGDPESGESDSLAQFDTSTKRSEEAFDQQLNTLPYQDALDATGVRLGDNPFTPQLLLVDGRKFVAALQAMPEGDEALRDAAEGVISHSTIEVQAAYVPPWVAEGYATNHLHPALLPEIADNPAKAQEHADLVAEMALNAPRMARQLARLGVDPGLVEGVRALRAAVGDGMVSHWAVASDWNLFHPPVTNNLARVWTQWSTPEEWQPFSEFLEAAATAAPPNSRFMSGLASTMLTNIGKLRRGELIESPPRPGPEPDPSDWDEDDIVMLDDLDWTPTAEDIAADQRREAFLDALEEKLRRFIR